MEGEIYIESDGVDSLSEFGLEEKDLEFIGGDYHSRRSFYRAESQQDYLLSEAAWWEELQYHVWRKVAL
ncbi:MAG TPA: hypothetical protein PKX45_07235 [Bacillota bacterium]|nr:hypothetical protein [Bacillota bacterium]